MFADPRFRVAFRRGVFIEGGDEIFPAPSGHLCVDRFLRAP